MQFRATNVAPKWWDYGKVNTLGSSFNYTQLISRRAGQSKVETFHPVPVKARLACTAIKWPVAPPMTVAALGESVTVSDPRPVAAAIEELERVSGKRITYEDPPLLDDSQTMPMVQGANTDTSLLIPKGGSLRFKLPADASAEAVVAAVEKIVADFNAGQRAATFSVRHDEMAHVVPRQVAVASGRLVPVTPVLDSKITLTPKRRSGLELLEEICRTVSAVSGQVVGVGTVPTNALVQQHVEISAKDEPARDVLEKLIAASGLTLSWRLLYDPGTRDYALNLPIID
jgi:hypothetical protein